MLSCIALGEDYEASDPLTATFLAAGGNVSCVDITILDDDAFEGNHTFMVRVDSVTLLSGITEELLRPGSASPAAVTIQDNDGMEVQ